MKLRFQYDRNKDIWCLLNKGSLNSQTPTIQYEQLVEQYGMNPSTESVSLFIDSYLSNKNVDIDDYVRRYQNDWNQISEEFTKRAEYIFGVSLPEDITAYLTINTRLPYFLTDNYFFVAVPKYDYVARRTAMHELWHFYTVYRFGSYKDGRLTGEKYNELKEALTVLLNIECADLLPDGVEDEGYPQHRELRDTIIGFWKERQDIGALWEYLLTL